MPQRVQLSRAKGWRMPENTVKVDRSTRWGNPFKLHGDGYPMTAEVAVMLFERHVTDEARLGWVMAGRLTSLDDVRRELRGKNLACWCKLGEPCHADVWLRQGRPSVLFRPHLSIDGNQWCALYGDNLQDGVAGFGDSPEAAMRDFDQAWGKKLEAGR